MLRTMRDHPDFIATVFLCVVLGAGPQSPAGAKLAKKVSPAWQRAPEMLLDAGARLPECVTAEVRRLLDGLKSKLYAP